MKARRWAVRTAVAGTVFIAIGAFWLSFTSLADLAARSGIGAGQAWAWPLIVDGIIVVATVAVVALAGQKAAWYPWALLIGGAVVSVTANALHAIVAADADVPALLAAAIAAVPPVVLLAITHLTVILTRATSPETQSVMWQTVTQQNDQPTPAPRPGIEAEPPPAALPQHEASDTVDLGDERPTTPESGPPPMKHVEAKPAPEASTPTAPDEETVRGAPEMAGVGRRERAAGLRRQGWSNKQIAAELGVHPSTVGRWLTSTPTRSPEPDTSPSMKEES
ncbi:DUF2637 domain-containing protein [Corynebacterium macclintockiae]|uniref:DUF2637 domain-containing protein n=1 Tax=Corynebacterium macclintockiae TaxID=2913501 RepID=UPI00260B4DDE|nr:DUF2637 domain-containing protein [uncultured Tessaracoccus sp.]